MANSVSGFYQTLLAAAGEYSKVLAPTNAFVNAVYRDVNLEEPKAIGQTIDVVIPGVSTATDVAAGDFNFTDLSSTTKAITLSHNYEDGFVVRQFEAFNTPGDIRERFLDSKIKSVLTKIDADLAALCTTTNFNSYTAVDNTGGTTNLLKYSDFMNARSQLAGANVPVDDEGKMTWVLHTVPWHALPLDSTWAAATSVGNAIAGSIRQDTSFPVVNGTKIIYDQNFAPTGTSGTFVYPGILLHEYAIALVSRPMPDMSFSGALYQATIPINGLPFNIMVSPSHTKAGWLVSVNCGVGFAVIRPEMGIITKAKQTP